MKKKIEKIVCMRNKKTGNVSYRIDFSEGSAFRSKPQFMVDLFGSALINEQQLEAQVIPAGIIRSLSGATCHGLSLRSKGDRYVLDEFSGLVSRGALRETEVTRGNEQVILQPGDKARIGDVATVQADGFRAEQVSLGFSMSDTKEDLVMKHEMNWTANVPTLAGFTEKPTVKVEKTEEAEEVVVEEVEEEAVDLEEPAAPAKAGRGA